MVTNVLHGYSIPGEEFFNSFWPIIVAACVGVFFGMRHYFKGTQCSRVGDLSGKVAIITGASSGIGLELTKSLAAAGAKVIMACRNANTAEKIISDLRLAKPQSQIQFIELNLASFASVKKFASEFKSTESKLDILINNGGIMGQPESTTGDGHEIHYQINYLSHFLLTHLLMDVLQATPGSRIVNNTAHAYKLAEFTTKGLINIQASDVNANSMIYPHCNGKHSKYFESHPDSERLVEKIDEMHGKCDSCHESSNLLEELASQPKDIAMTSCVAYAQSKLALILFTKKLALMFGNSTSVYLANPGVVRTNLYKNMPFKNNPILSFMLAPFLWYFMKTPKDGSQTALYCAVTQNLKSGEYYCECSVSRLEANALGGKEADVLWLSSLKACNL